jgi:RNA polymerase sigma-70 factor (ECF subfamily)
MPPTLLPARWLALPGRAVFPAPNAAGGLRELFSRAAVILLGAEEAGPGARPDPDRLLAAAARGGDRDAFEALVVKYQGSAYHIALRMIGDREEARDATQEAFLRVWRSLGSYRSEAPFSHWFYTVLANTCRSRLKHLGRRGFFRWEPLEGDRDGGEGPARQFADPGPGADAALEKERLEERLRECITRVPPDFREVLVLRDMEGFAYEDIAAVLDLSVGTVKSRLHRGRSALRALLGSPEGR